MKNIIQDRIKGMNFIYRSLMMTSNIDYINAFGTFEDEHKIKVRFHFFQILKPYKKLFFFVRRLLTRKMK